MNEVDTEEEGERGMDIAPTVSGVDEDDKEDEEDEDKEENEGDEEDDSGTDDDSSAWMTVNDSEED